MKFFINLEIVFSFSWSWIIKNNFLNVQSWNEKSTTEKTSEELYENYDDKAKVKYKIWFLDIFKMKHLKFMFIKIISIY
jgi:hypothetical protein